MSKSHIATMFDEDLASLPGPGLILAGGDNVGASPPNSALLDDIPAIGVHRVFLGGEPGLLQVVRNSVVAVMNFSLTPIPLFILMGELLFHTGLALKVEDGGAADARQSV